MKTRIFTLLMAFLATLSGVVWGQDGQDSTPTEECAFKVTKTATGESASQGTDYVFQMEKSGKDVNHVLIVKKSGLTISNNNPSTATNQWIRINGEEDMTKETLLEVTLKNVNIKTAGSAYKIPIRIVAGNHVKLHIEGTNSVEYDTSTSNCIRIGEIKVNEDVKPSSLYIDGTGTLNLSSGGPAIQGYDSPLTIAGGTINVKKGVIANTMNDKSSNAIINITGGTITFDKVQGGEYGIGGTYCDVSISGGTIKFNEAFSGRGNIGGGSTSKVTISGNDTQICMINPGCGIYANNVTISGGKYTVTDNRTGTSKKSNGIDAKTIILSNCEIEMDVQTGINSQSATLNIKDNATINIKATSTPISVASTDISNKSLVIVESTWFSNSGIDGAMTTKDGNAYVVANTNGEIEETDRKDWKGLVFEGEQWRENNLVNGYVYGNITLDRDFELKENYHLVYCEPYTLTIDNNQLINNGGVFIANEKENTGIEDKITKGTGSFSYQIFYEEESLDIPNSLKEKMESYKHTIADIIVSINGSTITDEILHKNTHPLNKEEGDMVFGKSKTNIALGLDTRIENSRNEKMYDSYIVKSFDVKTKKDGKVIAEGVTSFEMPDEAVVICNLKIEGAYKLTYELVGEDAEGLKVQFKDQKQNIIESAAYDDLVYIFISAPGYENFSVSEVSAKYTETEQNAGDVYDVTGAPTGYIVKILPSMPKGDVTFVISGEVGTQIPFKVSIDENIQNGTVTASKEDGTDATNAATTIYYENKIIVSATPDEGYELKSLKYINETTQAEVEIAYDEETNEYSFLMPASNVTITAVFELPESPEEPDDEGDDEQGGIVPDYPKYYNIYEDEICEGVTVEFSRDVVKEGQSVLVTVKVDEEFDATDLTLKFKRALFGYWEDLTLTPTENPGEYIIKNIYTDIYVRAEGAVPTGIEDIEGAKVYTKDGSIYVYTPTEEQVTIISISGAVLKNEQQIGLKQYTGLQRGIYIICIDEARFKVRL